MEQRKLVSNSVTLQYISNAVTAVLNQTNYVVTHFMIDFNGLMQDCAYNSIVNALELLQSCTKPGLYYHIRICPHSDLSPSHNGICAVSVDKSTMI